MKTWKVLDKNVRITLNNGKVFEGVVMEHTPYYENGVASICVGMYELYENEIDKIEECEG